MKIYGINQNSEVLVGMKAVVNDAQISYRTVTDKPIEELTFLQECDTWGRNGVPNRPMEFVEAASRYEAEELFCKKFGAVSAVLNGKSIKFPAYPSKEKAIESFEKWAEKEKYNFAVV